MEALVFILGVTIGAGLGYLISHCRDMERTVFHNSAHDRFLV